MLKNLLPNITQSTKYMSVSSKKSHQKNSKKIKKFGNYLDEIFKTSLPYLESILTEQELAKLENSLRRTKLMTPEECIKKFNESYCACIKSKHEKEYKTSNSNLTKFINSKKSNAKLIWGDCLNVLKKMDSESVQLMVTSPPYYNAREYSQWHNINDYLDDMKEIIRETYRVLDNHRVWVFNVGDIFDNPNTVTRSVWGKTRLPLGAYFIKLFEECGFTFVDDIIWDKGEVQSERHKNGDKPFPMYQYPMNCYEHILIFHKHRRDFTRFPCPRCGSLKVNGNTQSEPGLQSWECKNLDCFERSESNRGKRFSLKTNIVQSDESRNKNNIIEAEEINKWRRDIVKFSPVIKINSKKENRVGHSAPFPSDIPDMAVKYFTYRGEKVLDPFAGSFTTVKSAVENGRVGIGIELNKKSYRKNVLRLIKEEWPRAFKRKITEGEFDLSNDINTSRQL